jgi:hypothetical protein
MSLAGARHGGGASLVCGFHADRGKAAAGTACPSRPGRAAERERAERQEPWGAEHRYGGCRRTGS